MILTEDVVKSIDTCVLAWLATSAEGQPNVSPKEIFTHFNKERVLIANIASPQSVKNIKSNPQVCLSFVDVFIQKGFQLKGTAQIISKSDERFNEYAAPLLKMTGGQYPFASLSAIQVESVKEIVAPSYWMFPDKPLEERVQSAYDTYNVKAQ